MFSAPGELDAFQRLKAAARMTRYGGDCYGYCLLAAGFIDLIVEAGLKTYDVVALIPIIEGAGGRITTWQGKPATDGRAHRRRRRCARAQGGAGRSCAASLSRPGQSTPM